MAEEQNKGCFGIVAAAIVALWFLVKLFGGLYAFVIAIALVAIYILYHFKKCSREAAEEKLKELENQNKAVRSKYLKSLDDLLGDDTKSKNETHKPHVFFDTNLNVPKVTPIDLSAPPKSQVVQHKECKTMEPVKRSSFSNVPPLVQNVLDPLPVVKPCLTTVCAESKPVLQLHSSKYFNANSSGIPAPNVTHKETYVRLFQNPN